jgi:hypothetical protein
MSDESTSAPRGGLTRRDAVLRVGAILGGALVGQSAWLSGSARAAQAPGVLSAEELVLVDEVAETILPETSTPGAKAAGVGPFIARMVADTYSTAEQETFRAGLASIDVISTARYGQAFVDADPAERLELVEALDREQHGYMAARAEAEPVHFFRMIKELTLLGYFTSEVGCKQAQRYVESPGRFDPCVPYTAGERAWARHA